MAGNKITFLVAVTLVAITVTFYSTPRMQVMASRNLPLDMYNIVEGNLLITKLNDRACLLACNSDSDCSTGIICIYCGPNYTCSS
ncbi:unnamed protein product [Withania somnifera]